MEATAPSRAPPARFRVEEGRRRNESATASAGGRVAGAAMAGDPIGRPSTSGRPCRQNGRGRDIHRRATSHVISVRIAAAAAPTAPPLPTRGARLPGAAVGRIHGAVLRRGEVIRGARDGVGEHERARLGVWEEGGGRDVPWLPGPPFPAWSTAPPWAAAARDGRPVDHRHGHPAPDEDRHRRAPAATDGASRPSETAASACSTRYALRRVHDDAAGTPDRADGKHGRADFGRPAPLQPSVSLASWVARLALTRGRPGWGGGETRGRGRRSSAGQPCATRSPAASEVGQPPASFGPPSGGGGVVPLAPAPATTTPPSTCCTPTTTSVRVTSGTDCVVA